MLLQVSNDRVRCSCNGAPLATEDVVSLTELTVCHNSLTQGKPHLCNLTEQRGKAPTFLSQF